MISADILRRLSALRLSRSAYAEVLSIIAEVADGDEDADAELPISEPSSAAVRQKRYRERHQTSLSDVTRDVTRDASAHNDSDALAVTRDVTNGSPDKETSPTPPKETNPSSSLRSEKTKHIPPAGGLPFELTANETPKPNGKHADYPDEFEAVWYEYQPIAPKNATKADAFTAWKKLDADQRKLCWSGVVNYAVWVIDERKRKPDTPVKHLATFINKRGWEPFMEQAQ